MKFFLAGCVIAELSVPGISCEFLKRPHDLALCLKVQDLCLVDRIQTFGPEFELVVCSSGRSLLGFSPSSSDSTQRSSSSGGASSSSGGASSSNLKQIPSMASMTASLFETTQASNSGSLLALRYTFIKPQSPQHPVMLEAEGIGEVGQEEGLEDGEAVIHRVNVQCTAVDAIGE